MLNGILAFWCMVIALALRAEPLRRLRPLTLPLLLTAAAAFANFISKDVVADDDLTRWTSVALVPALAFLIARAALIVVFDLVLVRRMGFGRRASCAKSWRSSSTWASV
jgi:hypothetical protein